MEFHAILPVEYFKVFSATMDLFHQFSEHVNIDIRNQQLIMSTLNHSRTAQALIRFSPNFFQDYKLLRKGSEETTIQCTVLNKSLNSIIKSNFTNIASIKMCCISIIRGSVDDEGQTTSQMTMQLIFNNNAKKTNRFVYTDSDRISALYNTDNLHHFVMHTENIRDCFSRFDPRVSEISLKCTPHSVTVSTYMDPSKNYRPSRYSYIINSERCTEYSVIDTVKIVCNLKEFHAVVDFMDYMNTPLYTKFEDVGKPILFTYRIEGKLMLDIALMSQMDETENYSNIPAPAAVHVQVPNIREPTSSRFFNTPAQVSQPPIAPTEPQERDISTMTTAPQESFPRSFSSSPELPRETTPRERNYDMSSTESMPTIDPSQNSIEEPLFSRTTIQSSSSQRLTTLQRLRERKRNSSYQSPGLSMEIPSYHQGGSKTHDRLFPSDSNTTPEPRSSREAEGSSAPHVKEESSKRSKKQRPCIIEDSD